MFKHLKGDLFGGLTAGIVALPLALAFGVSSGLGPTAGLYGAIFISFFAALFGGTNTQISGPTAPMTAVSMVVIAGIMATNDGNLDKALPVILAVFLLAGLLQIVLGFLKLGVYIKYIPYPVVSGFMTAIGVIILITQILPAMGYYPKQDDAYVAGYTQQAKAELLAKTLKDNQGENILAIKHFEQTIEESAGIAATAITKEAQNLAGKNASGVIGTLKILPRALQHINWLELGLALATIAIIYGFKKITTAVPSTLVALIVVSGVAIGFGLPYIPIQEIPAGLPIPHFEIFSQFSFSAISPYIFTALTLALLGAIDSLLTSVVADNMTNTKHKPNKELIGQGIGNTIGALFGGIPGAGATIRTVINIKSGGKTRLSGMIAGVLLLIILLALGPVASKIPAAVLAGILVTVGIGVIDYKGLKAIPYLPKDIKLGPIRLSSEMVIMLVVMVLSSVWNLVYAVGIGLVMASLIFMKKIGDLTAKNSVVKQLPLEEAWEDEQQIPTEIDQKIFIKHINGPLFFGSTNEIQQLSAQIPETANVVVFRMDRMPYLDKSGLNVLEDVMLNLTTKGVKLAVVGLREQPKLMMEKINIFPELVPDAQVFPNFETCLTWLKTEL